MHIYFTSAVTQQGLNSLIKNLKQKSKQFQSDDIQRKLFFIGTVNSGKSSLINAILDITRKERQNVFYKDPFDEDYQRFLKQLKSEKTLDDYMKLELITSFVPGSTLNTIRINIPRIGFACYDTPGIFNLTQSYNFIKNLKILKNIQIDKQIISTKLQLVEQHSLWIGGICRVDNLSVRQQVDPNSYYMFLYKYIYLQYETFY